MFRLEMNQLFAILSVLISLTEAYRECHIDTVTDFYYTCGENETCLQSDPTKTVGKCICKLNFKPTDNGCVYVGFQPEVHKPEGNISIPVDVKSSNAVPIVIGCIIVLLLGCTAFGVYYGETRYKLVSRIRSRFQQRQQQSNYDELLIGQDDDDPPIA